jgi:hypothetical protein
MSIGGSVAKSSKKKVYRGKTPEQIRLFDARSPLNNVIAESANGEQSATTRFWCSIVEMVTIRHHCAVGLCKEVGCPFYKNEEDQELLMSYLEASDKDYFSVRIERNKRGEKKLKILV